MVLRLFFVYLRIILNENIIESTTFAVKFMY